CNAKPASQSRLGRGLGRMTVLAEPEAVVLALGAVVQAEAAVLVGAAEAVGASRNSKQKSPGALTPGAFGSPQLRTPFLAIRPLPFGPDPWNTPSGPRSFLPIGLV